MASTQKTFKKKEFSDYLITNKVSEVTIKKFDSLPETIKDAEGNEYKINIISTYHMVGATSHTFELNYYSSKLIKFLFPYKIESDVTVSINLLSIEVNKYLS